MKPEEIKDLLKTISKLDLREVRIKNKDIEIRVRTDKDENVTYNAMPAQVVAPVASAPTPVQQAVASPLQAISATENEATLESADSIYVEVKSPMVGTFYRSPSPEKPPYIQVGDHVSKGDVVCIIEAMKLFNEIESEISGKVVKMIADDTTPVEYDQVLFLVDPQG